MCGFSKTENYRALETSRSHQEVRGHHRHSDIARLSSWECPQPFGMPRRHSAGLGASQTSTPSVLWSPGPRRYVQAPLPVGDRGSGSDDARGGAKRRIAREPPGKRTKARRAWVKICEKEKRRKRKTFFARDTAALLLDCAIAHSIELALIASHGSQSVRT